MTSKLKKFGILVTIAFVLAACSGDETLPDGSLNNDADTGSILTGYNINWSFLPALNSDIVDVAASLNPKIIRYPGGSISKSWDWEKGGSNKFENRPIHTLDDLLQLKEATNAKVIFVLNTINKSLENQLSMLRTAQGMGVEINYIEMGNEHYLGKGNNTDDAGNHQDNVDAFPTGKEYADFVNNWAPAIRAEFPNAKIGITMLGRTNSNERLNTWNDLIVQNINDSSFDAFIYHIYVRPDNDIELDENTIPEIIAKRTDDFELVKINNDAKEVWITEYGVHADTMEKTVVLSEALADYIDSIADIAMPQVLYTKSTRTFFSLLATPDADYLTDLGEMFQQRWQ